MGLRARIGLICLALVLGGCASRGRTAKMNSLIPPPADVSQIPPAVLPKPELKVESGTEGDDDFGDFEDEFGPDSGGAPAGKVFDPLSGYNRMMFKVNDKFYFWLLKPAARGYRFVAPEFFRTAVAKAFRNMGFPVRFAGSLLQFKMKKAGTELGRFVLNSTVGVGGLWDPAGRWLKWHPVDEDLGQVFAFYGVGDGFPVVLPLLGQMNLRDGLAMIPAFWLYPPSYVADTMVTVGVRAGDKFNYASLHLGEYESIKKDALDPYTFIRDAYKQHRDKEIKE